MTDRWSGRAICLKMSDSCKDHRQGPLALMTAVAAGRRRRMERVFGAEN